MTEENVLLIVYAVSGLIGMPLINLVKAALKLEDGPALGAALAVSFALALAVALIGGQVSGVPTDPQQVAEGFGVVFSIATVFFKAFLAGKK